jgi:hypothetical protein
MLPETACALGELFANLNIEKAKRGTPTTEKEEGFIDGIDFAISQIMGLMPNRK